MGKILPFTIMHDRYTVKNDGCFMSISFDDVIGPVVPTKLEGQLWNIPVHNLTDFYRMLRMILSAKENDDWIISNCTREDLELLQKFIPEYVHTIHTRYGDTVLSAPDPLMERSVLRTVAEVTNT